MGKGGWGLEENQEIEDSKKGPENLRAFQLIS
jgi:hypothetical protein